VRDLLQSGVPLASALSDAVVPAIVAAVAFALASSGCYVINDLADCEADRAHPRKRHRPLPSGAVTPAQAKFFAASLFVAAAACLIPIPADRRGWVALTLIAYVANVTFYTALLKHIVIADVMGLSVGFVLRVMGGCAAAAITPSTWLLNVVFFLSMFLAFGKRLGERRTFARAAHAAVGQQEAIRHRRVQEGYTDTILQMAVVVTAVTTLMTYALYVQEQADSHHLGFNLLWITVLPATYGLLRAIVLLERGEYDDPTELAARDRGAQIAALVFLAATIVILARPLGL
jgi:4-hydroxybenzoate polyprenyltransferase